MTHRHTVTTRDGIELAATGFGDARACRAAVLIVPAMGVEQPYYAPFAHWLAEQGFFAVTFDDRGMGLSRPSRYRRSLRGFYASAPRAMRRIDPRMIGEPRIGHFGFFRRRAADKLWPQAAEWLAAQAERCRAGRSEGVPA